MVTLPNNDKINFQINQAFLDRDPLQTEALILTNQARSFGIIVDDCTKRHIAPTGEPCGQCIIVSDKRFGTHFDG